MISSPVLSRLCSEMLIPFATEKLALNERSPLVSVSEFTALIHCVVFVSTMSVSGS